MKVTFRLRNHALMVAVTVAAQLLVSCGKDDPDLPVLSVDRVYIYGDPINFAAGGDSHRFRAGGWSNAEPSGTWTDAAAASLLLRLAPTDAPLLLSAKLSPHIKAPEVTSQLVHLFVRGQKITTWRVSDAAVYTAIIPQDVVGSGGLVYIDFHIPGAIPPRDLGTGPDERRLGVACAEIKIAKADPKLSSRAYTAGTVVRFGLAQGAERYEVHGWSAPEKDFTWTEGTSASLELRMPNTTGKLRLRARMRGISRSPQMPTQPTDVYANGEKIAHWDVGEPADFTAAIPAELAHSSATLAIEFRTPMAIAPKDLGSSADARVLGVCVFELQLLNEGQ